MKFQQLATLATSGAVVVFAVYTVKLLIAFLSDLESDRERRISATPNGTSSVIYGNFQRWWYRGVRIALPRMIGFRMKVLAYTFQTWKYEGREWFQFSQEACNAVHQVFVSASIERVFSAAADIITSKGVLWDVGLIVQFVVQHSLLCRSGRLERCFGVLSRSVYVFTSCVSLVVLMYFWVPAADESALWSWNTTDSLLLSWGFTALHYVCWALILGGCYILDIGELVGLKQVWYGVKGYGSPLQEKAWQFVRCLGHMRHPGLTTLAAILWMRPTMHLDRAVLALCFTVYTYVAHDVDVLDFEYVRRLCEQKARSPRSEGSHARR